MDEFKLVPKESVFFDLNPDEATLFFYILGLVLSQSLTIDELRVLGTGLFLSGEVLLTVVSQRLLFNDAWAEQKKQETANETNLENQTIEELQSQVADLLSQIEYLQQQMDLLIKK